MTLFTKNRTHYQQPNKWVLQCLSNSTSQYIQSFLTNHNPYISTITTTQNHITYIIDIFTLKKQEMIFLNKIPTPLSTTNKWVLQYLTIQLKPYLKLTLQQRTNVKREMNFTPWCKPWEAMSMILAPLPTSDSLSVIASTKSFPITPKPTKSKQEPKILTTTHFLKTQSNYKEREKKETLWYELLAAREDIGERLKKGLEVLDGRVRWEICDGYRLAGELDAEAYGGGGVGGGSADVSAGDTALHFRSVEVVGGFFNVYSLLIFVFWVL